MRTLDTSPPGRRVPSALLGRSETLRGRRVRKQMSPEETSLAARPIRRPARRPEQRGFSLCRSSRRGRGQSPTRFGFRTKGQYDNEAFMEKLSREYWPHLTGRNDPRRTINRNQAFQVRHLSDGSGHACSSPGPGAGTWESCSMDRGRTFAWAKSICLRVPPHDARCNQRRNAEAKGSEVRRRWGEALLQERELCLRQGSTSRVTLLSKLLRSLIREVHVGTRRGSPGCIATARNAMKYRLPTRVRRAS